MSRIPSTLHLTVLASGGGTETLVRRLCDAVPEFSHLSLEEMAAHPRFARNLSPAVRHLRSLQPELVFCYGARAHLAALLAWRSPSAPPALVGSIRGEVDFSGASRLLLPVLNRRIRFWIANSQAGLSNRRGFVIHNGISPPPSDEAAGAMSLTRPAIGLIANDRPMKGHRFLLDLWLRLGKPGSLVFAGNLGPSLRKDAEQHGVRCLGFCDPGPLLRSLDLAVLPSTSEGFPNVLLEAMSRGVPCLATPVGGVPELISHAETGFLLPREQWENFLRGADWEQVRAVGRNGAVHVREHFRFEDMVARFADAARQAVFPAVSA